MRSQLIPRPFLKWAGGKTQLIDAYTAVRDQVEAVIQILAGFTHSENFYYEFRAQDPWAMD